MTDQPNPSESVDANELDATQPDPTPLETNAGPGAVEMTADQLAEAKQYAREDLVCDILDKILDVAYLAVMALIFATGLEAWLSGTLGLENTWLRLGAMFVAVTLIHVAVSFPLSFFSGHYLEHKYGLSNQSLGRWFVRYLKRNGLMLAFNIVMIECLFLLIWLTGSYWWLAAAAAFFVVSVLLGQLVPVLILPMFYKIDRLENDKLANRFAKLTEGTGLAIEGVYRMELSAETSKANAMLAGLGATRRVILGDTLLEEFTEDEIAVVFAHEVGHHVHRHIRTMILNGLLFSVGGFLACHWIVTSMHGSSEWTRTLPVAILPLMMLTITLFSMLLEPLQNAISRRYERQSDRYALDSTGDREAYRSAFSKLARINKADPDPHPVEVFLLHSHPPITERLAMADQI